MPVKFYLLPRKTKQGESPIRVSVSIKYARLMTNIGYTVAEEVWANGKVSKPKYKNTKGATALMINERISAIESHFNYYELHLEKDPTLEDLKRELDLAMGKVEVKDAPKPREKNLFDHLQEFIREESINCTWASGTMQCWAAFTHHMERFSKRLKYTDFDEAGLNRFVRFLRIDEGLEEKTVQKQFNNLKWFLNWVIRKGQRVEETYPKYELIGTHAGRRTFICFALSSGVPPQVVMKWTGHSDYKAMKPYIDIAEKTKADAMKLIEDAWDR